MDDKLLYVLAGYDDATESALVGMQNKLYEGGFVGTHTKNLLQHITLASYNTDREYEITELVRKVAKSTAPFDVALSHIGIFSGGKVLFVAPDKNRLLLDLQEQFAGSSKWTPHTTMLIDEPEIIRAALSVLVKEFKAFRGKVETLHLYEFFPARHIISLRLTGTCL